MKYLILSILLLLNLRGVGQQLEDYLREAAENNPGIKARFEAYMAALQQSDQAASLPDPQLAFGYFIMPVETRVGPQQARISLSQMFPWFGILGTREDMAVLEAKARYAEFEEAKNELFFQVRETYYALANLETTIRLHRENLELLRSFENILTSKFESGQGSMVNVIRAQMEIEDLETEISIIEEEKAPLRSRFNALLNRDRDQRILIDLEEIPRDEAYGTPDSLNYAAHPLIRELTLREEAALKKESLAKLDGRPDIGVGFDYMIVGSRDDVNLEDNGRDALMPMVTLSLPIYRKRYKAAREQAVRERESLRYQREDFGNRLQTRYDEAVWTLEEAGARMTLYRQQAERAGQAYRLLAKTFSAAGEDFEEVLRMLQKKLKYELARTNAEKEYRTALARIDWINANNILP